MLNGRCPMLHEILGSSEDLPPLSEDLAFDVCIVGGGYLGLWTAIRLRQTEPELSVCIIESDICGGGASGRNSGMALAYWPKIEALTALCGEEEALRLCDESQSAISSIDTFCKEKGIDIEFANVGWLWGSTCARHDGRWQPIVEALARHGRQPFADINPPDVKNLVNATGIRCGVLDPSAATIQPAKLARGLRKVALDAGVRIFERTPMTRLQRNKTPVVETSGGSITAGKIVIAMNAWSTQLRELARGIFVITSDDIISNPMPEQLDRAGWTNGPIITNSNTFVAGYRPTRDGRVVAGITGGAIPFGALRSERYEGPTPRANEIRAAFKTGFAGLIEMDAQGSWRGPIDRTRSGIPVFGRFRSHPNIVYGYGFSGNGIVGCYLGSEIVRSLVLERDDTWTRSGLVRSVDQWMPFEPVRYFGAHMVRNAVRRQDACDHVSKNQTGIGRYLASLAPGGIVTTSK